MSEEQAKQVAAEIKKVVSTLNEKVLEAAALGVQVSLESVSRQEMGQAQEVTLYEARCIKVL